MSPRERVPALSVVVPRFSNVALVSVVVLAATGIGEAIEHMPAVNALWETGYGQAILVKTGLLGGAMLIASGNLLRSRPRLIAAQRRPELGEPAARLLRRLVSGEVVVVVGIVFAAAVLSSLAPPPPAFALENSALAKVGPGPGGADRSATPATCCRCWSRRTRPPRPTRSRCGSPRAGSRCAAPT